MSNNIKYVKRILAYKYDVHYPYDVILSDKGDCYKVDYKMYEEMSMIINHMAYISKQDIIELKIDEILK